MRGTQSRPATVFFAQRGPRAPLGGHPLGRLFQLGLLAATPRCRRATPRLARRFSGARHARLPASFHRNHGRRDDQPVEKNHLKTTPLPRAVRGTRGQTGRNHAALAGCHPATRYPRRESRGGPRHRQVPAFGTHFEHVLLRHGVDRLLPLARCVVLYPRDPCRTLARGYRVTLAFRHFALRCRIDCCTLILLALYDRLWRALVPRLVPALAAHHPRLIAPA